MLARGRQVSLEGLINGLWGEQVPPEATSTVRTYASRLRRGLDPGAGRQRDQLIQSGNSPATDRATSTASLVLPTPPGPVTVTSGELSRKPVTSAISAPGPPAATAPAETAATPAGQSHTRRITSSP
jgi:hypothetical protein